MGKYITYSLLIFVFASCSNYQKVLKSADNDYKFAKAVEYFNEEKFVKAYPIFEELMTLYRGTAKAQEVYYYLAMTHFRLNEYLLAAYHFKNFHKTFPKSEHAEEAHFLVGYSYYKESPDYSLDQTYTFKAINELQLFVNRYRTSHRMEEANNIIIELRRKLERKAYEKAKQYYITEHFQAAAIALSNVLNDFPETRYREEIMFMVAQSRYELAINSIPSKQLQRFIETRTACEQFEDKFPASKKVTQTREILERANYHIQQLQIEIS